MAKKCYGHRPIVGDCFCGGSNIFEPPRIGCDIIASDLNPVAALLTWADLNVVGAEYDTTKKLHNFQQKVYNAVDTQIAKLGIETNEDRALSYLYCVETVCPECGCKVRLAPSWVIGKGTRTIAILSENDSQCSDIQVRSGVTNEEIKKGDASGTVNGSLNLSFLRSFY